MALNILLTNDDGYTSAGLMALQDALLAAGENVRVVAPAANQSGQGSSLGGTAALASPVAITEFAPDDYFVDGRPVTASLVGLGALDLFDGDAPDLVISGTNEGANIGGFSNISGTVNAAVAALHQGIPAIAISAGSSAGSYDAAYANAAEFLVDLLDTLEANRAEGAPLLPTGEGLTIDVPGNPDLAGLAVTRIDQESSGQLLIVQRDSGLYGVALAPNTDPSGNPVSQGAQFLADRLTVAPIDGDWTASDSVRLDLASRLDGALGDGSTPEHGPLKIMLVNEDGIESAGLRTLRRSLRDEGYDVTIVAPASDQSGIGTALTLRDFAVEQMRPNVYSAAATPTSTVYTALDALLLGEDRPDLIISGIDEGSSLGLQGNTSATLAAAVAGVFNYGIPSLSVNLHPEDGSELRRMDFRAAADIIADLIAELQASAPADGSLLPPGIGLDINMQAGADGSRVAFTRDDTSTDARLQAIAVGVGQAQVGFGGPVTTDDPLGEGNAFAAGNITITPIDGNYGSDDLAAYDRIAELLGVTFGVPGDEVFA